MNYRLLGAVLFFCIYCGQHSSGMRKARFPVSRGFLIYRTVSFTQKSCTCGMTSACSCCQNVVILYTKMEKNLCVNFTYQGSGLNINVSLDSVIIKTRTVTDYKAFKFCVLVPGCFFSSACINILELNLFPRSVTACLRLDIFSRKQRWQINYNCISISTELPMMTDETTTATMSDSMAMPAGNQMENTEAPTTLAMQPEMSSASMMPPTTPMPVMMVMMMMPTQMMTNPPMMNSVIEMTPNMMNTTMMSMARTEPILRLQID